ncbi:MAG TPA: glycoside hydrolase family 38 C-terminal domain-containing protein, partial [Chloroflexota bacterium]
MARPTFWIVPHTHWDREWYLPSAHFEVRLVRTLERALDLLEQDPRLVFVLDGQTSLIDDYLAWRPHDEARCRSLVNVGRLHVGPFFVQPDEYLAGQEALVRNLLLGLARARALGPPTMVGYLPDTFGHIAQLPQILQGFGVDTLVFWRGLGEEADRLGAVFLWEGLDGSRLVAVRQLLGYGNACQWGHDHVWDSRPPRANTAVRQLRTLWERTAAVRARTGLDHLLVGVGGDHEELDPHLARLVDECQVLWPEAEFSIGGFADYVRRVRGHAEAGGVHRGELDGAREVALLRGVTTTRVDLKQRAEAVERATIEAEAVNALAALRGHPYPADALRHAWQLLLRNLAHDSIGGCAVDEVRHDLLARFARAEALVERLRREGLHALAGREAPWAYRDRTGAEGSVLNVLPYPRRQLVAVPLPPRGPRPRQAALDDGAIEPVQIVRDGGEPHALFAVDVPGWRSRTFALRSGPPPSTPRRLAGDARSIENEFYRVVARPDGSFDVLHKPTGRVLSQVGVLVDEGDRGDTYNFCPVEDDTPVDSRRAASRVRRTECGPVVSALEVETRLRLPAGLARDRHRRLKRTVSCRVSTRVRVIAGVDRVEFTIRLENRARDHRLRVLFPVGSEGSQHVRVEGHYGVLRRAVHRRWGPDWPERPGHAHHTLGAVEMNGVVLLAKGLPEYEVVTYQGSTALALTLLRCVGWLSRDDLTTRPGHAGPPLPTPEAQCLGSYTFECALRVAPDADEAAIVRSSQDYRFQALVGPPGASTPAGLSCEGDGWGFATLKIAERGDGLVVRLFNPGPRPAAVALGPLLAAGYVVALDEERRETPSGTT